MAANQTVLQLTQQTGSANTSSVFYAVTGGTTDTGLPLSVLVNNLGLTGVSTAPTATAGTSTTQLATTAFVATSFAPLASPALTGVPTVPTATPGTNTTQIASTSFVVTSYAPLASPVFTGAPSLPTGTVGVTQTAGNNSLALATTAFVATSFAPLASPALTGIPTAPTASAGTNTTQIATTAFATTIFAAPPSYGSTTPAAVHATTVGATGLISPSTTVGIAGTTAADNAQAGSIGEFITGTGSAVSMTSGTGANIASISLTAGDWDVVGNVEYNAAATTTGTFLQAGVSTTSATLPVAPDVAYFAVSFPANFNASLIAPVQRINITTTTTVFLVAAANFATSTLTCSGRIRARRVR